MTGVELPETALFLPDGFDVTMNHCGQRMKESGIHMTWAGKPGQGAELSDHRFTCPRCPVTVTLAVRQPRDRRTGAEPTVARPSRRARRPGASDGGVLLPFGWSPAVRRAALEELG